MSSWQLAIGQSKPLPRITRIFRSFDWCSPYSTVASAGNPLLVAHIVHVNSRIALKLAQAFDGAEIKRFRTVVVAGCGVGNADFHFADWIDRHGRASWLL